MNHISSHNRPISYFKFFLLQYFKLPLGKIGKKIGLLLLPAVQEKTTCFNFSSTTAAARRPALHTETSVHVGGKWEEP